MVLRAFLLRWRDNTLLLPDIMSTSPPRKRPVFLRWQVWIAYAVLFALAIPWYWPADQTDLVLGVPLWVAVTLCVSFAISAFTAWLLITGWPPDQDLDSDPS
jgi:4-amino-4-deoxy-L-arabinose transferase-like glycosyltransferase